MLDLRIGPEAHSRLREAGAFQATPAVSLPSLVRSRLIEELSLVLGDRYDSTISFPTACLSKAVAVCGAILPSAAELICGSDLQTLKSTLGIIIALAETAYQRNVNGALHVLFDAKELRLLCDIFVVPDNQIEAVTHEDLRDLATLVLGTGKSDRSRQQRYYAKLGEVLKICGTHDANMNGRALEALRYALKLGQVGKNYRGGYHPVRSLPIVAARCSTVSRVEFEQILGEADACMEINSLTVHEKNHVLDGRLEANAVRFQAVGEKSYRDQALQLLEKVRAGASRPADSPSSHMTFSARVSKLPVVLGQAGIFDQFGSNFAEAREAMRRTALSLREQAEEKGLDRTVEQMTRVLVRATD